MIFIFHIIVSVCISFSWRLEYLWHSKRSADGQVLLKPMEDIAIGICVLCNESYCLKDRDVHEKGLLILRLR